MKTITTPVPALDKAIRVCNFLAEKGNATFSQIYLGVDLPKSSTSTLLNAMVAHGMLRQERDKYSLGLLLFELGNKAIQHFDIKTVATPLLAELRDSTNLTCHLGVLEGGAAIYLLKMESPQAVVVRSWEGKRLSLYSSGLGKVLLAWQEEQEIDDLLPESEPFTAYTEKTITRRAIYKQQLAEIRQRGWACDDEEDCIGVRCISAPVRNSQGDVIAAISVSGVLFQLPEEKWQEIANQVQHTCSLLSTLIQA
ncbi:IclR family transcriptional regulator [Serratia fonticola]|uniref:IclR family transcriptional regulator n=1 Tax=Serratia fonticola TaxID=47917 RepID=A0AAE7EJZ3_SERFO|nr:IclR family transcriptional regulator [Serratia fonticola]QKJ59906.1 IclR family transcriptional regulator [Serratia fonticola]